MQERRYRVYDGDALILDNATADDLHEKLGIHKGNLYRYAGDDTLYETYKRRYRIRYADGLDTGPGCYPKTEQGFEKKFGIDNLLTWQALNAKYGKEKK